jgi:CHAD domain-containing protein
MNGLMSDETMLSRFAAPDGWTLDSLRSALGERLEVDASRTVLVTHLDTFDWRIHAAGAGLTLESEGGLQTLQWRTAEEDHPYVLPVDGEVRFFWDLPEGFLRAELEQILEVRALLPMGANRVDRRSARVVDTDGNTTARLVLGSLVSLDPAGSPASEARQFIQVQGQPAHDGTFLAIVKVVRTAGATDRDVVDDLLEAAAVHGRWPGDYSSKPKHSLRPDQRSDDALRAILGQLLTILCANVDGVIDDIDVEFLHDLRVATRRTRSALAQIKGVLPKSALDTFVPEFKWLGTVTNPCRDFDVFQLEMNGFRGQLGTAVGDLDPLQSLLEHARADAHLRVTTALRTPRFRRLLDGWQAFLESPAAEDAEPPNAGRPVGDLAAERILKAYKRVVKRGSKLSGDPPAEALHRLRIDAKKLRYLLEFFASLYPPKTVGRLVKELKQLQDILGGFNDMEVQQAQLTEFARELAGSSDAGADTMLAMGRLGAAMERRQEKFRHAFAGRFAEFASDTSRRQYRKLFGGG